MTDRHPALGRRAAALGSGAGRAGPQRRWQRRSPPRTSLMVDGPARQAEPIAVSPTAACPPSDGRQVPNGRGSLGGGRCGAAAAAGAAMQRHSGRRPPPLSRRWRSPDVPNRIVPPNADPTSGACRGPSAARSPGRRRRRAIFKVRPGSGGGSGWVNQPAGSPPSCRQPQCRGRSSALLGRGRDATRH
jgi:hypothetical protein